MLGLVLFVIWMAMIVHVLRITAIRWDTVMKRPLVQLVNIWIKSIMTQSHLNLFVNLVHLVTSEMFLVLQVVFVQVSVHLDIFALKAVLPLSRRNVWILLFFALKAVKSLYQHLQVEKLFEIEIFQDQAVIQFSILTNYVIMVTTVLAAFKFHVQV
jgi:hypothetical protein